MAPTNAPPRRIAGTGYGYAYLMTGIAIGCICISGILGSIEPPRVRWRLRCFGLGNDYSVILAG